MVENVQGTKAWAPYPEARRRRLPTKIRRREAFALPQNATYCIEVAQIVPVCRELAVLQGTKIVVLTLD